ncbi:MAG: hypothetical protein JO249_26950 [Acidobacteria bacterium]|nr:hypothetical protein [Acidobacteriota bacterium]
MHAALRLELVYEGALHFTKIASSADQTLAVREHPTNGLKMFPASASCLRQVVNMRTIIFAFLIMIEVGLLILAVANVQPNTLASPLPPLAPPATVLPFRIPLPVTPAPPTDTDCPADNVRKQSCEPRYLSST